MKTNGSMIIKDLSKRLSVTLRLHIIMVSFDVPFLKRDLKLGFLASYKSNPFNQSLS